MNHQEELRAGARYDVLVEGTWLRAVCVGMVADPPCYGFVTLDSDEHTTVAVPIEKVAEEVRLP